VLGTLPFHMLSMWHDYCSYALLIKIIKQSLFCSFSSDGSRGCLDNVLLSGVGVGALSLLGVNSENVRSVSSGVLDSLVSSALRGLLGFNELVNLRGLLSDLFLVDEIKDQ